jgi:hypothetical protein
MVGNADENRGSMTVGQLREQTATTMLLSVIFLVVMPVPCDVTAMLAHTPAFSEPRTHLSFSQHTLRLRGGKASTLGQRLQMLYEAHSITPPLHDFKPSQMGRQALTLALWRAGTT